MLSRIGSVISNHREGIGLILIGIGILWLMGVAGTDDYYTARCVATPLLPLVIKSVVGLIAMAAGVEILSGGGENEDSL